MPVADILERAREVGLDVVAITDHDSAAGGLEARELADRYGVRVIVGEEVKSSEGEVIGLFLERTIPGGMTFAETIAAIREQGGIIYVPHPFDRLHTIPSPSVLRANVADIDVRGGLQLAARVPRVQRAGRALCAAVPDPGGRGQRLARAAGHRHQLCAACDDFTGPDDFVAALAESRIVRRPRSLIYLQSLKLLQTTMGGRGQGRRGRWILLHSARIIRAARNCRGGARSSAR